MTAWTRIAALVGALSLGGCGSTAFEMLMPGGETLKGSVTTTAVGKGAFYATDGKVTCTGPFRPELFSRKVSVIASCSDNGGGEGEGESVPGGGGVGAITLKDGRSAAFRYGEAAK